MYDELVKVLRGCVLSMPCDSCPYYDPNGPTEKCATMNIAAADAIEELAAFKAQITDGKFYVYKLGKLFELRHDPRDLTVKFQYPEPPKEE